MKLKINRDHISPNFEERAKDSRVSIIVIHATGVSLKETLSILTATGKTVNPSGRVSAHFVVDTNGDIYQLVDEDKRAWHAGLSEWKGITDVNSHSIGIELVNDHPEFDTPYPPEQIAALAHLVTYLKRKYAIADDNIVGHSDVAPGRKTDPGPRFPWGEFRLKLKNNS